LLALRVRLGGWIGKRDRFEWHCRGRPVLRGQKDYVRGVPVDESGLCFVAGLRSGADRFMLQPFPGR
jgi:hypothetical protein